MKKIFYLLSIVAIAFSSCSKSPEDVVQSIYDNLAEKNYEDLAEYVFPDSVGDILDSDLVLFREILDTELRWCDVKYTLKELKSCQIDSTGNYCDFEVKTTFSNGKSYNEKGRLYKTADEDWLLDLGHVESEYSEEQTAEAVPNINAAVCKTLAAKGVALFQTKYHWLINDDVYFYEDKTEAFNNAKRAAQQGLAWGMSTYAWDLETGYGTEDDKVDDEGAFEWYLKAAEKGHLYSMDKVARKYLDGIGVIRDSEKAFEWAKKGSDKDYENSMLLLAWMYDNGKCVEENNEEAMRLWKKNAEINNSTVAMRCIGHQLQDGDGEVKDDVEAFTWFKKSADLGNSDSQNVIGNYYYYGWGNIEQNYQIAVDWYRKAAKQENSVAQYNLGNMYYNGKGVNRDYSTAKYWYKLAADQGYQSAKQMYQKLWRY